MPYSKNYKAVDTAFHNNPASAVPKGPSGKATVNGVDGLPKGDYSRFDIVTFWGEKLKDNDTIGKNGKA